jgi:LysR family glycine cleavage system transcriptional activator
MKVTTLFPEEVFPVCSPNYLAQFKDGTPSEEIFGKALLYLDDSQKDWVTWAEWFEAVNYPMVKPKNRVNINNYPMLLQAAINGQGVALAWGSLIDDYLENGSLVRPVETVLRTEANFSMLEPSDRGVIPSSVKHFRSWLLDQLPGQVGQKGLN